MVRELDKKKRIYWNKRALIWIFFQTFYETSNFVVSVELTEEEIKELGFNEKEEEE